ncbi:MAG: hydroxymethylglutaryl-CoA lyase [Proteobacteria bacterium]|nr:hydroxymethylglutaryl-CoA lyase [Pseudomonadota bacterium]
MREVVHICEVGLRDGLQNESAEFSVDEKMHIFAGLVAAGLEHIEIGSFVNPKAVPAMANTDLFADEIKQKYPTSPCILGLIMNERGLERAIRSGVDGVCIVSVVSESLCQKNNRCSAQESVAMAIKLLQEAKRAGLFVRVDIATAWVCPYEGAIPIDSVKKMSDQIWEYGPDEMAFCDSIGHAHPFQVRDLFAELGERYDRSRLVAHFHDTKAMGLANASAALLEGIRRFDASLGGLGGCPFAPGAKGNLATEDLAHLCASIGFETGMNIKALRALIAPLEAKIGRELGGQSKAWFNSQSTH